MYRYKLFKINENDRDFDKYLNDNVFVGEPFLIITKNKKKSGKNKQLMLMSRRPIMSNKVNEINNTARSIYYTWDLCRDKM